MNEKGEKSANTAWRHDYELTCVRIQLGEISTFKAWRRFMYKSWI